MKLIPFNVKMAKAGAKIVTRCGLSVRISAYDVKNKEYPILGLVKLPQSGREIVYSFTENGKALNIDDKESKFDLFIVEEL